MDAQHRHEVSQRLRRLKADSEETNRSIADAVGVGERTVAGWLSPGNPTGISYSSATKVAELFEVDVDWLWYGELAGQLGRIERKLDELLSRSSGKKIAELFEVDVDWLWRGEVERLPTPDLSGSSLDRQLAAQLGRIERKLDALLSRGL